MKDNEIDTYAIDENADERRVETIFGWEGRDLPNRVKERSTWNMQNTSTMVTWIELEAP
jgi:hypothetical protein